MSRELLKLDSGRHSISRRTVAKGVAWSVPVLSVGVAAPAFAASLQKDPGINGWVQNRPTYRGWCSYYLDVDSTLSGTGPDGAPYGLYLYDITDDSFIANPKLTYWIIGDQQATWQDQVGHSDCWTYTGRGTPQVKADGLTYTPYTWDYDCTLNPADRQTDVFGVERLYLGDFHVRASFTQPADLCRNVTYWTQRFITIDPDGPNGSAPAEELTFERRNGTLGPYTGARQRARSMDLETDTPTDGKGPDSPKLANAPS